MSRETSRAIRETVLSAPLADGNAEIFVARPEQSVHPVVLFYMDAPGIREELYGMARRLAQGGYFVVLPDPYYRSGAAGRLGEAANDPKTPEHQNMWGLIATLTMERVIADTKALIAWINTQSGADGTRIGALGYCMSGRFALAAATAWPDLVKAAASIYGTQLVTEDTDSPHRQIVGARATLYFGFAETDVYAPAADIPTLQAALSNHPSTVEFEVYPGVGHGFAFPNRANYDEAAAERHWSRLFDLFDRTLTDD